MHNFNEMLQAATLLNPLFKNHICPANKIGLLVIPI
jgi:hypothetical protein